jgi:Xaa-Pro aminopeptidase
MTNLPFDSKRLDVLMEDAGVDWVLASSEHNTRYLLGGYRYFFHEHADAIGLSRYLPLVGYSKGQPDHAFYIAAANESWQLEVRPIWIERVEVASVTSAAAAAKAGALLEGSGGTLRIGVEPAFLPSDAMAELVAALPGAHFLDATALLETLRSVKSAQELLLLRKASEGIVEAMLATFRNSRPEATKDAVASVYAAEVASHGLTFDYALITVGRSLNRAPYGGRWEQGQLLSLDSGGRFQGYVGDLCRMAVRGQPDSQLKEALEEVDAVQVAARSAIRAGTAGGAIYEAALKQVARSPHREHMRFVSHGMGLITHEAPRLTDRAVAPYPATHFSKPLEAGMVLSVETQIAAPAVGFVKLEDTLFVTEDGWEAPGDIARGWTVTGED